MNLVSDHDQLLGLRTFAPTEAVRAQSRFKTSTDYTSWLERNRKHPEDYWQELSTDLAWSKKPSGVGSPGNWFPGGKLNACHLCLDHWLERGEVGPGTVEVWENASLGRVSYSRSDLLRRVAILCSRLESFGLDPATRVLLALPQGVDLVAAILACLRLGLTCVPCDPSIDKMRIMRRVDAASCRASITSGALDANGSGFAGMEIKHRLTLDPGWDQALAKLPGFVDLDPLHPAFAVANSAGQLFTLPTAGFMIQASAAYECLLAGGGAGDLHWFLTPPHHTSFLSGLLGALAAGGRVALAPAEVVDSPAALLSVLRALEPRVVLARIKTLLQMIGGVVEQAERPTGRGPELFVVEGETVEPRMYHYLREGLFDGRTHVIQVLSRPEGGGYIAGPCAAVTPVRPASVALPAPGIDLAVVDDQGTERPVNHGGLVAFLKVTPGLPIEMQQARLPFTIGVQARMDQDGRLWTMGEVQIDRPEEEGLALPEQEALIASVAGVEQVAVVRYQDPTGTRRTCAYLKISGGPEILEEIRQKLEARFGTRAIPDSFRVVAELPYSRTGKLLRGVLRRIAGGDVEGLTEIGLVADPAVIQRLIGEQNLLARETPKEPEAK